MKHSRYPLPTRGAKWHKATVRTQRNAHPRNSEEQTRVSVPSHNSTKARVHETTMQPKSRRSARNLILNRRSQPPRLNETKYRHCLPHRSLGWMALLRSSRKRSCRTLPTPCLITGRHCEGSGSLFWQEFCRLRFLCSLPASFAGAHARMRKKGGQLLNRKKGGWKRLKRPAFVRLNLIRLNMTDCSRKCRLPKRFIFYFCYFDAMQCFGRLLYLFSYYIVFAASYRLMSQSNLLVVARQVFVMHLTSLSLL